MRDLFSEPVLIIVLVCLLVFLTAAALIVTRRLSSSMIILRTNNAPLLSDIMPYGTSFAPDHEKKIQVRQVPMLSVKTIRPG